MTPIQPTGRHLQLLFRIPLFEGLTDNTKEHILQRLDFKLFRIERKEIAPEYDSTRHRLHILLEGKLRVETIDEWGNCVVIEDIIAPRAFATPHLFNTVGHMQATFTVLEAGTLLQASKESLLVLLSEVPQLLKNFLAITSRCNKCTVIRLRALTQKSVRNRLIVYLLEKRQHNNQWALLEHNHSQLADYLCVTRPALSKEINLLVKEGLIALEGRKVQLLQPASLEAAIV